MINEQVSLVGMIAGLMLVGLALVGFVAFGWVFLGIILVCSGWLLL